MLRQRTFSVLVSIVIFTKPLSAAKTTSKTMARLIYRPYNERVLRRERVVRDRTNPLDIYNDEELIQRFLFSRVEIFFDSNSCHFFLTVRKSAELRTE